MSRSFFKENILPGLHPLEEGVLKDRHKLTIAVVGIGRGAGTTFICMNLALRIGELEGGVTYVEGRQHSDDEVSPYRLLMVDKRFTDMKPADYFIEGHHNLRVNLYKQVNWVIRIPGAENKAKESLTEISDYSRLTGRYIIIDEPENFDEAGIFDVLIVVVDPLPSRVMSGLKKYKRLKHFEKNRCCHRVIYVLNKNPSRNIRYNTEKFLRCKFEFEIGLMESRIFYDAQFNCTQPFFICTMPEINRLANEIISIDKN